MAHLYSSSERSSHASLIRVRGGPALMASSRSKLAFSVSTASLLDESRSFLDLDANDKFILLTRTQLLIDLLG